MKSLKEFIDNSSYPILIAEIGVNHNGRLDKARKLSLKAIESGADIVKFQYWKTARLQNLKYTDAKRYKMLEELELSIEDLLELKKVIENEGRIFLCTPDEEMSAIELKKYLGMNWVKIGSGEINNFFFLEFLSKEFEGVILSTGASSLSTVKKAANIFRKNDLILMHTVSCYPTNVEKLNLNRIKDLANIENIVGVGFSDHSMSVFPAIASVAMGVKIIEKHFTISREDRGPDHKASLLPEEFSMLRLGVNQVYDALKVTVSECEKENEKIFRKGAYWKRNKKMGEVFKIEDIIIQRPNMGVDLEILYEKVGKVLKKDVIKGEPVMYDDV